MHRFSIQAFHASFWVTRFFKQHNFVRRGVLIFQNAPLYLSSLIADFGCLFPGGFAVPFAVSDDVSYYEECEEESYFPMYAANAGVAMKDPNRGGDDAGGDGEEESDDG